MTDAAKRLGMIRWSDRLAFAALGLLVLGHVLAEHPFWRPKVSVRSCGGNFELLRLFARDFEQRHACRVEYVAAPVQFLLELAAADERHLPEAMVGRSGPGWALLQKRDRLAGPPRLFAVDPLVIVTPAGNPAGVRTLPDLGRDGVRVLSSPDAMRPKGRVIGGLMADVSEALYPGLVDRWERNTVEEVRCGRLLAERLRDGVADAAILARSQTALPPLAGACEVVEIPPDVLDLMRSGRGSLPQSVGRTVRHPANPLADRFADELVAGASGLVARCGYVPAGTPGYERYEALLVPTSPQPMAERQMDLAAALQRDGATREAVRRYLYVIHVFGPSRLDAEAWYRLGAVLRDRGEAAASRAAWQRLVQQYPTRGRKEWLGILALGDDVGTEPERPWIERAAQELKVWPAPPSAPLLPVWLTAVRPAPLRVREGDPPKGARRTLAVAVDLLHLGLADFAVRDALKVAALDFPSPHTPAARAVAGSALLGRGDVDAARGQWRRVSADHPGSPWAGPCADACRAVVSGRRAATPQRGGVAMPPGVPCYDTHVDRAMAYGAELYEAGLPLYALKEYLKVVVGVYGEPARSAEARFRAGVCLAIMGHEAAALRQWESCQATDGAAEWGDRARQAGTAMGEPAAWPKAEVRQAVEVPTTVTAQAPASGSPGRRKGGRPQALARLHLGEELLMAGVLEDDEALQEFLKVLTVVEVPPGLAWTRAVAHVRAAQVLVLSGRPAAARCHAEQAAAEERPAEGVALAGRLLAYLRQTGGPQP